MTFKVGEFQVEQASHDLETEVTAVSSAYFINTASRRCLPGLLLTRVFSALADCHTARVSGVDGEVRLQAQISCCSFGCCAVLLQPGN